MTKSSIKCDACSLLDLDIKRLILHCGSSFARTPLCLQLALVGFPSCNLLKLSIYCHLLAFQLQPQCCLCYIQPLKCDFSGVLNCPFLAGSQSVLYILLFFHPFQTLLIDHTFHSNFFTLSSCIFPSQFLFLLLHSFRVSSQNQTKPLPIPRGQERESRDRISLKMW